MNSCCRKRPVRRDTAVPLRRGLSAGAWLIPGGLLVLMPKCPVCVAGYIALLTGAGVSIPAAAGIRTALMILCSCALLFLACRLGRKLARSRAKPRGAAPLHFRP